MISPSPIFLQKGLLFSSSLVDACQRLSSPLVIITDENVGHLYGKELLSHFLSQNIPSHLLLFPMGEKAKNSKTKRKIEEALFSFAYGRRTTLIALGGGVVTDLVGFTAATYLRGVPYLSIPTSLIGMIDASIGGKTGINTQWGKNTIGAFYPPISIWMDPNVLESLPNEQKKEGFVEGIKYGVVAKPTLLNAIANRSLLEREKDWEEELIAPCCSIKQKIVQADPLSNHERNALNFGHTIGHAIEKLEKYSIGHGTAVALGMLAEGYLNYSLDRLSKEEFSHLQQSILSLDLSLSLSPTTTPKKMVEAMKWDKKNQHSKIHFVLLRQMGLVDPCCGQYCAPIEKQDIYRALEWLFSFLP